MRARALSSIQPEGGQTGTRFYMYGRVEFECHNGPMGGGVTADAAIDSAAAALRTVEASPFGLYLIVLIGVHMR